MSRPQILRVVSLVTLAAALAACESEIDQRLDVSAPRSTMSAEVGGEDQLVVTVRNTARKPVQVQLPELPDDLSYDTAAGTCGALLAPGATCRVVLDFTPSSEYLQTFTLHLENGQDVHHEADADDEHDEYCSSSRFTLDSTAGWSGVRYVHDEGPAEGNAMTTGPAGDTFLGGKSRELLNPGPAAIQGYYVTRWDRKGVRKWTVYEDSLPDETLWGISGIAANHDQVCYTARHWVSGDPVLGYVMLHCRDARTGAARWSTALGDPDANTYDRGRVALAANGDVLAADTHADGDARRLHLFRYSADGDLLWHEEYAGDIGVTAIAATSDGLALAANVRDDTFDLSLSDTLTSGVVARLDADGVPVWATEVGRVTEDDAVMAWGVAVDGDDRVYSTTWRDETGVWDPETMALLQVRVVALDADGDHRWTAQVPMIGLGGYSYGIAVSPDGQRVLVGGSVQAGTATAAPLPAAGPFPDVAGLLAMFDADGNVEWVDLLWTGEDGSLTYTDVRFSPGGQLLASGIANTYRLNGALLPADILPVPSGEDATAGFVRRHPATTAPGE